MSENDSHTGRRVERVTLTLDPEQRASLDREAARRSLESGRLVTRSAMAREIFDRALLHPEGEAA